MVCGCDVFLQGFEGTPGLFSGLCVSASCSDSSSVSFNSLMDDVSKACEIF